MAELFQLEFESKLLIRERSWGRRIEVDQWAGGSLLMERRPQPGGESYLLREVLESPWTLRWYPTKDELKLGTALHVERPKADPYGTLAPLAEPIAVAKRALWWDGDPAVPGSPWSTETGHFWATRHRLEAASAPPLAQPPTYPFHILGPLAGRFEVRFSADETIVRQRLTKPWLADGWRRWVDGEQPIGYGYWGQDRPHWEPRLYESIALAHRLFDCTTEEQFRAALAALVEKMQPRAEGRAARWLSDDRLRLRVWRPSEDRRELQVMLDDRGDERRKLFVRIAYRALGADDNSSGN